MTLRVKTEPTDIGGGNYLSATNTDYSIRGIFIPNVSNMLLPTGRGDIQVSTSQVQIPQSQITAAGLSGMTTLIQQVVYNSRTYTVMRVEDYTGINGCWLLEVVAEVDADAY
jgi:hypothetical protein